jgi:hypothetical protein
MTDRNFYLERLYERAMELKAKHQGDNATYLVELAKAMKTMARNDEERRQAEVMLKEMKTAGRFGLLGNTDDDERKEVVKQVRETLKARHPWTRFDVWRLGPRSTRRWGVQWSNGPSEVEIRELIVPFARKDLTFRYFRKSEPEAPPVREAPR